VPRPHRLLLAILFVFALAFALRMVHLNALRSAWEGTQLFSLARGDAAFHWQEAQDILDQDFWLRDRVPWKGPLYSYLLAFLMNFVGREPAALRWPLAVLGAFNCAFLVALARRVLPLRWSVVAGSIAAINGVVLLFDGELFFPTVLVAINLPALWLLTRPGLGRAGSLGAGALLGLAALVHPVYLLSAFALAIHFLRSSRSTALALLIGVGVVVLPVSARNVIVRGEPVLVSWSGGVNLYIGNQPGFDQSSGQGTAAWARVRATPEDAGLRSESQIDREYLRLTLRQAMQHPLTAVRIVLLKCRVLFSPVEIANNFRLYELREFSPVLRVTFGRIGPLWLPFGLFAPFALLGLWGSWRRAGQAHDLTPVLFAWSFGLALSMVMAFNTARYRMPLVFFGSIWVAWAIRAAFGLARTKRWRELVLSGLGLAVLVALVAAMAVEQRTLPPPYEWSQAKSLEAERQIDSAETWVSRARAHYPHDPLLAIEVARFYGQYGWDDRQDTILDEVLAYPGLEPDLRCLALERRARTLLRKRDLDAARRATLAALAIGVDRSEWRQQPYFQMDLVPSTSCRLRLLLADIELRARIGERARELVDSVRNDCPGGEGLRRKLRELELRLAGAP
jgi:hypothetical protein